MRTHIAQFGLGVVRKGVKEIGNMGAEREISVSVCVCVCVDNDPLLPLHLNST